MKTSHWLIDSSKELIPIGRALSSLYDMEELHDTREQVRLYETYDRRFSAQEKILVQRGNRLGFFDLLTGEYGQEQYELTTPPEADLPRFWFDLPPSPLKESWKNWTGYSGIAVLMEGEFLRRTWRLKDREGRMVCDVMIYGFDHFLLARCLAGQTGMKDLTTVNMALLSQGNTPCKDRLLRPLMEEGNIPLPPFWALPEPVVDENKRIGDTVNDLALFYLKSALFYERGIITDFDTECLHQYRISLRKVRSLLAIMKKIYPPGDTERVKDDLKEIQQRTNHLRDLDVHLLEREYYTGLLPDQYRHNMDKLYEEYEGKRDDEQKRLTAYLNSPAYKGRIGGLIGFFSSSEREEWGVNAYRATGEIARKYILKRYVKISREIEAVSFHTDDALIHELRINFKKIRYLLEFFSSLLPRGSSKQYLKVLKRIQGSLGVFNDLSVQQRDLGEKLIEKKKEQSPGDDSMDVSFGLGILIGILSQQQSRQKETLFKDILLHRQGETDSLIRDMVSRGKSL